MKLFRIFSYAILLSCLVFSSNTFAVIDSNAPVVQLQHPSNGNCMSAGAPLNNCFTTFTSLNSWIITRAPTATTPLLVQVGPGNFTKGTFTCNGLGNITLQGAGRQNTILAGGMSLTDCNNLSVSDMTITGGYGAITWSGTGVTRWTNVEVIGQGQGWYETNGFVGDCDQSQTKHYWFNSHIEATPHLTEATAYLTWCGESWFFGSELVSSVTASANNVYAIQVNGTGEAHLYGSVVRTLISSSGGGNGPFGAVYANGGMIHLHGTGIDMISQIAVPIVALTANAGGMIHANGVGYFLSTAGGATVTRIENDGGTIMAPYLWEEGTAPQNINSADGADMQVITSSTGHPHVIVIDSTCPSMWFDTATQACH